MIRIQNGHPILTITANVRASLTGEAMSAFPDECCGVLFGYDRDEGPIIEIVEPLHNVATNPRSAFAFHADCLMDRKRKHRGWGDIMGFYHSHPFGTAWPSKTDIDDATAWAGYVHAITAMDENGGIVTRFFLTQERMWSELSVWEEPFS